MLSGESTGTGLPSRVRHSGIRVDTRAETSANSPSTAQSASMAWPPVMVSTLAPFARTPCQMRPGPRWSWACTTQVRFAVSTSPMSPAWTRSRAYRIAGALRACRPTMVLRARWRASPAISSASARVLPSGHSHSTALPACSPAITRSRCPGTRTQTTMRSMSGCAAMSLNRWNARSAPNAAADALAVSSCAVQTAFSS